MAKKKVEVGESAKYVTSWQDGYRSGTREGFEWCIQAAMMMNEKAQTEEGKKATAYMAQLMKDEIERRQSLSKDASLAQKSET